ncbi:MAG: ECF transporter S component [Oscillospiraceae bacterium]|jgi:riboflavin transporter FmnP|nr:ECF transporter S component [Oscillospiraceae bacterium]
MKRESLIKLTSMAVLAALSVVAVVALHFPLLPAAPEIEYDAADVFILLAGLFFGWVPGLAVLVIAAVVQAMTVSALSGPIGLVMHLVATGALVLVACGLHDFATRRTKAKHERLATEKASTGKGWLPLCLLAGCLAMTAVMIPMNLLLMPWFRGVPVEAVQNMIVPVVLPFNLLKSGINSALACALYFALTPILRKISPANG